MKYKPSFFPTLLLSLFLFWPLVHASEKPAAISLSGSDHSEDPYGTEYQFTEHSNKFAGQKVDTDRFRHPVILENSEQTIKFANFLHEGKYWIAEIKKSALVDKIYFHVVRFDAVPGVTAAHTQYRIKFQPGGEIRLHSQNGENETTWINDIVISYEASRPKDIPYNFVEGINDNYAIVTRVLSGRQRAEESVENITEQYELLLNGEEAMEMLLTSLEKGSEDKFDQFYNTLYPNCTTEVFSRLDALSTRQHLNYEKFLTVLSNDPIAGPSLRDLKLRKVLGERAPNLGAEIFEGQSRYIPSPADTPKSLGLFPEELADQFSLVFHSPHFEILGSAEKQLIRLAEAKLYALVGQILQSSLSLTALDQKDGQKLLQEGLLKSSKAIQEFLVELEEQLPEDFKSQLVVYFAPYQGSSEDEITSLLMGETPARLPFKAFKAYVTQGKERNDLLQIQQAPQKIRSAFVRESSRKSLPLAPFHLNGLALQLSLKKGHSQAEIQIIGGMNPTQRSLGLEQGHVRLDTLEALAPKTHPLENRSLVLLHLKHQVNNQAAPPLHVEFGRDLGHRLGWFRSETNMITDPKNERYGLFSFGSEKANYSRLTSAPYFHGEEVYFGIDLRFPILSLDIDLPSLSLSDIRLRVFKPILPFSFGSESINRQFKEGINKQINELKNKMLEDGGDKILKQVFTSSSFQPQEVRIDPCEANLL